MTFVNVPYVTRFGNVTRTSPCYNDSINGRFDAVDSLCELFPDQHCLDPKLVAVEIKCCFYYYDIK